MVEIRKVAVVGAGVMGASIAAHVSNAGVPVVLLDIVPAGAENRNVIAEGAVQKLLNVQPSAFMHEANARLVTSGNIEDHLELLADVDWVVEAVVERLDVKRAVYKKIDSVRRSGAIVSSNTSTIPLRDLVATMPEPFARDFLITHFFNPPRYMRLLELVSGERTRPKALASIRQFADVALGKGVVMAKDTPGFIGNRVGVFWLQCGLLEAIDGGLTVEEADAVMSQPVGIPKTGVFGLLDLVGLDLQPHVLESMRASLPEQDPFQRVSQVPALMTRMIAGGHTGRKGDGGFYRLNGASGSRVREAIDLETGEYRALRPAQLDSITAASNGGVRALVLHPDIGGRYAWRVLAQTLSYAAGLVPEIANDIVAVDDAMKLGYNWKFGPFELIDQLGTVWFAKKLRGERRPVPALLAIPDKRAFYRVHSGCSQYLTLARDYRDVRRAPGILLLADVKRRSEPLAKNASASLWNIGDGVVCLEFHTKMNVLDSDMFVIMQAALETVPQHYKALVIYNEGPNFSAGANLGWLFHAANRGAWREIESTLSQSQQTYQALKYAPFPVVAAPAGLTLGGGCELLLHCDAIQAHAETYVGLVETTAGLVPAWGGCKEMLLRWRQNANDANAPIKVFAIISAAVVARSAVAAKELRFLRSDDGITMNRDRLLADAKAKALMLTDDYTPPDTPVLNLPGPLAKAELAITVEGLRKLDKATAHDERVANTLADVVSGGDTDITTVLSEEDVLALERKAFMSLLRHPDTLARIEHLVETGKPLRN